jgi:hypothetical protein
MRLTVRMTQLPHGWVKFAGASFWRSVFGGSAVSTTRQAFIAAFGLYAGVYAVVTFTPEDLAPAVFVFAFSTIAIAVGIVALVGYLRNPQPEANFDTDELRIGKRTIPFADITEAAYFAVVRRRRVDSHLVFGARVSPRVIVTVAAEKGPVLDPAGRELVAEILRRSSVAIPVAAPDPYDPTGKFAYMDHPNSLTKSEAIEYVLHTPESGEPNREKPPPKSIWIDED